MRGRVSGGWGRSALYQRPPVITGSAVEPWGREKDPSVTLEGSFTNVRSGFCRFASTCVTGGADVLSDGDSHYLKS